jgi:hypothetical protein
MDYLVIEGYKSAAEEFSLETGVQPAVDFASIESRGDIRDALNRGDVQGAITRVNDLNPEVNRFTRYPHSDILRIKHCMHHSQPPGDDDHAKPSVFKMITLSFLVYERCRQWLLIPKIDTRHQPGSVLSPSAAKTHRVYPPGKYHGGITVCTGGTSTSRRRESRISGGARANDGASSF